jgi:hypothetical protein
MERGKLNVMNPMNIPGVMSGRMASQFAGL